MQHSCINAKEQKKVDDHEDAVPKKRKQKKPHCVMD